MADHFALAVPVPILLAPPGTGLGLAHGRRVDWNAQHCFLLVCFAGVEDWVYLIVTMTVSCEYVLRRLLRKACDDEYEPTFYVLLITYKESNMSLSSLHRM
jgi:hypothetical protein